MQTKHFSRAAILTAVTVLGFVVCWEVYWRNKGFIPTYNDDEALWAEKRSNVYKPIDAATVFTGASRIKFDLDIPTWEKITGEKAVQLALVGTSPRRVLAHLANDKKFKGKVIVDVTEDIFFGREKWFDASANEAIEFYEKYTPAQKASSWLNYKLEANVVFLERNKFGLNELLLDVKLPPRKGTFPGVVFPKQFELTTFERQTYMGPEFLADTNLQRKQTNIWSMFGALDRKPGISGDTLINVFKELKDNIDKIKAKGGQVLFVRTPASGPYQETEDFVFPREKYWDAMLQYTNAPGIHFKDYPETANYICPEWSHLSLNDAIDYTKHFVKQLKQKGWTFKNNQSL